MDEQNGPLTNVLDSLLCRIPQRPSEPADPSSSEDREDQWLAYHGVPKRYRRAQPRLVEGDAWTALGEYCVSLQVRVDEGRGVLIVGPVGTGKSCALACVAKAAYYVYRQLPWDSPTCEYVTAGHLYARIMHPEGRAYVRSLATVPLLLLDELGASYETPFSVAQVDLLFEDRYNSELATCIATNMTAERLQSEERWARIYDRLKETCVGIELSGPSRRGL